MTRFDRLQALRGLAALCVVGSHFVEYQQSAFCWEAFPKGAGLGWFGVDIFFVLSGFIIAHSTLGTSPGLKQAGRFAAARAARIYLPWWAALGGTGALVILAPHLMGYVGHAKILNEILLFPDREQPLLSVGWTLVMEMFFYAVFATLILLPVLMRAFALWAWAILIGALAFSPLRDQSAWANVAFNPLCLEFLMGVAIARLIKPPVSSNRSKQNHVFWISVVTAISALITGAAVISVNGSAMTSAQGEVVRVIAIGIPAAALVWLMSRADLEASWPNSRLARWATGLGDRSYALYLVHYPIISAVAISMASWSTGWVGMSVFFLGAAILCAIATEILHILVERPAIQLSKRLRRGGVDRSVKSA